MFSSHFGFMFDGIFDIIELYEKNYLLSLAAMFDVVDIESGDVS